MEPQQIEALINRGIIAAGCGAALYSFSRTLWAGILATVMAWMYRDIALAVAGGTLLLFLAMQFLSQRAIAPETEQKQKRAQDVEEVIDVEYEVLESA